MSTKIEINAAVGYDRSEITLKNDFRVGLYIYVDFYPNDAARGICVMCGRHGKLKGE